MNMTLPPNCAAHLERMLARPAVQRDVASRKGWPEAMDVPGDTLAPIRSGILRHGETDWNAQGLSQGNIDIPLNELGLAQAREAAEKLRNRGIATIVASPLSRARVTAEIVGEALGLPVAIDPDLREVSWGVQEGKPMAEWFHDWICWPCDAGGCGEFRRVARPGGRRLEPGDGKAAGSADCRAWRRVPGAPARDEAGDQRTDPELCADVVRAAARAGRRLVADHPRLIECDTHNAGATGSRTPEEF